MFEEGCEAARCLLVEGVPGLELSGADRPARVPERLLHIGVGEFRLAGWVTRDFQPDLRAAAFEVQSETGRPDPATVMGKAGLVTL